MGITGVRNLCWDWFPEKAPAFEKSLNAIFDRIGFSDDYVQASILTLKAGRAVGRPKVIKDNVWGMVEIDCESIRLLDCPVVQRLRGIRQLGFSYLTYPSAEHSRFIHSLGMHCVIARFLDAIGRPRAGHDEPFPIWEVPEHTRTDLLHAAILHDVGHMAFSHATEKIYESFPGEFYCGPHTIEDFLFKCEDFLEKPLPLSECLSLAVILSPRFQTFYSEYVRPNGGSDAILRVASLIAGIAPDDQSRGVAELVSDTAVDADKVDYINRDSVACGIPVGIDVARLFLRSAFVQISPDDMYRLRPSKPRPQASEVVFIVNASGVDTIEELAQARAALYHRVYLHQTTRNAERLLGKCLEALADDAGFDDEPFRSVLEAWATDDFALLNRLTSHKSEIVAKTAKRLRNRDLPKRACAFGRTVVQTQIPIKEIFRRADTKSIFREITGPSLEALRRSSLKGDKLKSLENDIRVEAAELANQIKKALPQVGPRSSEPGIVAILPMHELEGERKNCIVLENNQLVDSPMRTISNPQGDAADIFKAFGYVMTDPEWREVVFLAARTVFSRQVQPIRRLELATYDGDESVKREVYCLGRIILDSEAVARRAGLNVERLGEIHDAAEKAGYFDDKPLLAPLRTDSDRIGLVAERLSKYCGQGDWSVSRSSCEKFISQFPPKLRKEMLEVLAQIEMLDRSALSQGLMKAIKMAFPNGIKRGHIVALSPDSGSFVRAMWDQEQREQLSAQNWTVRKSIEEALQLYENGDSLLLCDDNMVSGSQADSQFLAWAGVPREEWPVEQRTEHGIFDSSLRAKELDLLKEVELAIAVCVGTSRAHERLLAKLQTLGFRNFKGVFAAQELNSRAPKLSDVLEGFLQDVGARTLAWCRHGSRDFEKLSSEAKDACNLDALGYAKAKGLITTPFNTPTSTLTALWCPGFVGETPWMPLLMRRGYLKHLILA